MVVIKHPLKPLIERSVIPSFAEQEKFNRGVDIEQLQEITRNLSVIPQFRQSYSAP
jgi:hypothetical protein